MTTTSIIGLLALGFLLLLAEIFVLPGIGLAGVVGTLALLAGLAEAFFVYGPAVGSVLTAVSLGLVAFALYIFPKTPFGKRLVLEQALPPVTDDALTPLIGARGIAVTPLRPVGRVRFGHNEVDAITDGEYIESGESVEAIRVESAQIVVQSHAN
ncbi:MAG: NfeD family protein [Polyangiales bacterium]